MAVSVSLAPVLEPQGSLTGGGQVTAGGWLAAITVRGRKVSAARTAEAKMVADIDTRVGLMDFSFLLPPRGSRRCRGGDSLQSNGPRIVPVADRVTSRRRPGRIALAPNVDIVALRYGGGGSLHTLAACMLVFG